MEQLDLGIGDTQVKKILAEGLYRGDIRVEGKARATRYFITPKGQLLRTIDLDTYYATPIANRAMQTSYNFELIREELPRVDILTADERKFLTDREVAFRERMKDMPRAIYLKEMERLGIDLSWKSSEIEGNTYTLLETVNLLKDKIEAKGKKREEAIMLLNHKEALKAIVERPEWFQTLSLSRMEDVHSVLIDGLGVERNLRHIRVGISGTNYRPLEVESQIREAVEDMCTLVNGKADPYEKALLALLLMLFLLILLKTVATAVTIGSGGVGGTFGPSLIVGGLSGYFVATLCNEIGFPPQSAANFALVGMAAVMTGVMQAPFMAVLLIAEITGGYALMVPLLVASAVTYCCVSPFEHHSIYARKLAERGDLLTHDKDQSAWSLINMRQLIETNFISVREGDKLRHLVEAIKNSKRNLFPVLTEDNKFLGVIHMDGVRSIIFQPELYDTMGVEELMFPVTDGDIVHLSDSPQEVVAKFHLKNKYNLIVLDDDGTYVGILSRANVFSAYRRFVRDVSEE